MRKILTLFLTSSLTTLAYAEMKNANWASLGQNLYLNRNSITVYENPKQIHAQMYLEEEDKYFKYVSALTVDCKTKNFYFDDLIYKYDNDFHINGTINNIETTKQKPKKITNEAVPSVLLTLCDDSKNAEFISDPKVEKLKYDRNSSGQMYNLVRTDEWLIFHWVINGMYPDSYLEKSKISQCKTSQSCLVVASLISNYLSLNFIPDQYRYQDIQSQNIKKLALANNLTELKKYKLNRDWFNSIFAQAESSLKKDDPKLSRIYALLLYYQDVTASK